jgi:CRISPR-associated protein Cmr5
MAHQKLLAHVKDWLNDPNSLHLGKSNLVEWVSKEAQVEDYRRATAEAIAFLVWVKRFAEAELA